MPPKKHYSRIEIIESAIRLIRRKGVKNLSARNIADVLGSSTHPVYSSFESMKELEEAVYQKAHRIFLDFITRPQAEYPYLEMGIQYVEFAVKEKNLFSFLFMNKKAPIKLENLLHVEEGLIEIIKKDEHVQLHSNSDYHSNFLNLWIYTHGLAALSWAREEEYEKDYIRKTVQRMGKIIIEAFSEK